MLNVKWKCHLARVPSDRICASRFIAFSRLYPIGETRTRKFVRTVTSHPIGATRSKHTCSSGTQTQRERLWHPEMTNKTTAILSLATETVLGELLRCAGSLADIKRLAMTCRVLCISIKAMLGDLHNLNAANLMRLHIAATLRRAIDPSFPLVDATRFKNRFFDPDDAQRLQCDLFYMWYFHVNPRILFERDTLLQNRTASIVYTRMQKLQAGELDYLACDRFSVAAATDAFKNQLLLMSDLRAVVLVCQPEFEAEILRLRRAREIQLLGDDRREHEARERYTATFADPQPLHVNLYDATNRQTLYGVMQKPPSYDAQQNRVHVSMFFPPDAECEEIEFDWSPQMTCFKARRQRHSPRPHPYARPDSDILLDIRPANGFHAV